MGYKPGHSGGPGQPSTLSKQKITEIIRLRSSGKQYKEIAIKVGCTPDQAVHYWRSSLFYKPESNRSAAAKKRKSSKTHEDQAAWRIKRLNEFAAKQHPAAVASLKREIEQALREADPSKPYKVGLLRW